MYNTKVKEKSYLGVKGNVIIDIFWPRFSGQGLDPDHGHPNTEVVTIDTVLKVTTIHL